MSDPSDASPNRLDRRRAKTRAALVAAAQELLAADRSSASVLEITQAADVGLGSFYNHFVSKEDLFRAAVEDALNQHRVLMDSVTDGIADPAEVFTLAFRLTGRLHRVLPGLSQVLLRSWQSAIDSGDGLAAAARDDIVAAIDSGRFGSVDPELAMVAAGGAAIALGELLHREPERDDAEATDNLALMLLRGFGLDSRSARRLCQKPVPDLRTLRVREGR